MICKKSIGPCLAKALYQDSTTLQGTAIVKDSVSHQNRAVIALLTALSGKEAELLQVLGSLADLIEQDPTCAQSTLARSVKNGSTFVLCTVWKDAPSLAKFMTSEVFRVVLGASNTLSAQAQFRLIAEETPGSAEVTNANRAQGIPGRPWPLDPGAGGPPPEASAT
jgi:quinol monooxygenase YgiN